MNSDNSNRLNQVNVNNLGPLEFHENAISGVNHCQTTKAQKLILTDIAYRLQTNDQYDIGGTYTREEPDLWFYYTTSEIFPDNYLLNLFVKHRKSGTISIGISNLASNEIKLKNEKKSCDNYYPDCPEYTFLPQTIVWKTITSPNDNLSHHIMTYSFTEVLVKELVNKILCIPIKIEINPNELNKPTLQEIKKNHSNINSIIKQSKPDFILESASKKQYPMHKIFLVSHSSVFRDLIRNKNTNVISLDINDEEMELLIEFFYSGLIKDIENKNISILQELANKFDINKLKFLIIKTLCGKITIDNAIDLVVLSEKYKLEDFQETIFKFITANNAEIMQTEGWKNLNDATITKKMLKAFYSSQSKN